MTNKRDREVLREWTRGQEPSEWELKLCWINEKTGNRITPGQVIREIVVKHRVKRVSTMVEGIWKSKARAREEDSQWKASEGSVEDGGQGLANHGWTREEGGGG